MFRCVGLAALGAALAFTCARAADPPPLSAYAADPAIAMARVSPGGTEVAFIRAQDGQQTVFLLASTDQRPLNINFGAARLTDLVWVDELHLVAVHSAVMEIPNLLPRQEINQGVTFNKKTRHSAIILDRSPTAFKIVSDGLLVPGLLEGRPVLFLRGVEYHGSMPNFGLYAADAETGQGVRIDEGSFNSLSWAEKPDGTVLARAKYDPPRRLSSIELRGPTGWKTFDKTGDERWTLGLGHAPGTIVVEESKRFAEMDTATGVETPLRSDERNAIDTFFLPSTNALVAIRVSADTPLFVFFDPALATAWRTVLATFPGKRVALESFSNDYAEIAVSVEGPGEAGDFYWVHLRSNRAEPIGQMRPGIAADQVGLVKQIDFKASDGLPITGYLTLPPGQTAKDLPLVVLVHDGPDLRDTVTFDPTAQALASRGYAVFQVNYRGSAGVSDALQTAGYGQWGRAMQTDLSDGAAFLAGQGVIDAKRVCIMGYGYGGYAALAGVTLQSGIYRCAISIDGISNLASAIRAPDAYERGPVWTRMELRRRYIGVTGTSDAPAKAVSPVRAAGNASAPILLISDDWQEVLEQTNVMYDALARAGKPVQRVLLKGVQNQLLTANGREQMLEAALAFLAKNNPADLTPARSSSPGGR